MGDANLGLRSLVSLHPRLENARLSARTSPAGVENEKRRHHTGGLTFPGRLLGCGKMVDGV